MSKALQLTGGSDVKETAKFVEVFDHFFDCMNVNSYNTGRLKRKIFKQPYRSATDFWLKVCEQRSRMIKNALTIITFFLDVVVERGVSRLP